MASRVNSTHWEIIISFMERNKDLARGWIHGISGKEKTKKLWVDLTTQLNSAGFGERPVKKWQKTWTDFKHSLKKKAANIKEDINATGGGFPKADELTNIEERVLGILGPTFYKGVGRSENGCNFGTLNEQDLGIPSTSQKGCTQELVKKNELIPQKKSLPDDKNVETPMQSGKKRLKLRKDPMEAMYTETLNELKEIKDCLKDLTNCCKGIQSALEKIADK